MAALVIVTRWVVKEGDRKHKAELIRIEKQNKDLLTEKDARLAELKAEKDKQVAERDKRIEELKAEREKLMGLMYPSWKKEKEADGGLKS